MLRLFWLSVVLILTGVLLGGCEFKDLTLNRVDSFKIDEMSKEGMRGTISLVITNPNNYAINVTSADFDLYSSGVKVGDAKLHKSFKIKANSTETYPVELKGNLPNLLAGGITSLIGALSGKSPEINIKGDLKARAFLVSKTIPIDVKTKIPLDGFKR
jgi:LEA14-like dessication related protein